MKNRTLILLSAIAVLLSLIACHQQKKHDLLIEGFEIQFNPQQISTQEASYELLKKGENHFLHVKAEYVPIPSTEDPGLREGRPGVTIEAPEGTLWNVKGYSRICADVTNTGKQFFRLMLNVQDTANNRCFQFIPLEPGETKTIAVRIAWTPWVFNTPSGIFGMNGIPGKTRIDITAVKKLEFFARRAKYPTEFTVDNVRATGELPTRDTTGFFPFVDQFGQYIHQDWKGKIHSLDELKKSIGVEQADLTKNPGPKSQDQYGGWTTGPKLKGTGFFRTEKYSGKWWMVDPEGYLFWSAGMNCVTAANEEITGVQYRERYYQFLPEKTSDLGQFYEIHQGASKGFYKNKGKFETYNFYQANLFRKYGNQWHAKFDDLVHQRFKSWGMNTLGFVSDTSAMAQQKTPYVGSVWIRGVEKIPGSKIPDVFQPGFREAVHQSIEAQKAGAGDPWCIGFYIDNEMGWGKLGSLSQLVLKSPATQPAKIEFVNDLKKKYQTIQALNSVWGTSHDSWDALIQSTQLPNSVKAGVDLSAFYGKLVDTYYRTVSEEFKKIAPNQCYMGSRFQFFMNDVTLRTAAKYMDIISINQYTYSVSDIKLPSGEDKPVIIGEFHIGSLDRGFFHPGLREAKDQAGRGVCYQNYVTSALDNSLIVGAHWFQYIDQSITGRGDGENYNIGFIDVCDNPYYEVIDKVRETNYKLYETRFNDSLPQPE